MKFIFGAGGTGGHINPALALAEELQAGGHICQFIGNANSMESQLCAAAGYPITFIRVQKLYRSFKPNNLLFPIYLAGSIATTRRVLKRETPDAVICTGGFVSGPVAIAAVLQKVPLFFHESNSFPGLVTRYMAKYINTIYISFESTRNFLKKANLVNLGIPLKPKQQKELDLTKLGLSASQPTILVSGGSQGSLAINQVIDQAANSIIEKGFQLLWQTGKATYSQFTRHQTNPAIYLFPFSPELPGMLSQAHIAITRAGAMSIAEQKEAKVPAILIPLPTAAENHQFYNAKEQENLGLAIMIPQRELNPQTLLAAIEKITSRHPEYKQRLEAIPPNRASKLIVADILAKLNTSNQSGLTTQETT